MSTSTWDQMGNIWNTKSLPIVTYAVGRIKFNDSRLGASLKGALGRLHFNDLTVLVIQKLRATDFVGEIGQQEQGHAERKAYEKRALPKKTLHNHALHHYRASFLSTAVGAILCVFSPDCELQQRCNNPFLASIVNHDGLLCLSAFVSV